MADDIRIPVSADTTRLESDIANAGRRAQIVIRPTIDGRGIEGISRPLGKITGQADEFSKSMEAANARVLAFGASVGVLNAVAKAFENIVTSSIEVEKTLKEISVASGESASNLDKLGKGIFSVARNTGTSFKEAADAALEFSRQGAGMEESLKRAQAALVLTRTTGLDAAESVRGLTAAVQSFNQVGLDYEAVVNKLASVDTKFAVSSKDLIEGISRSASVAQEAGVSFDELTALITTLQEKTARGGAVIGNALKTIFTRVQSTENLDLLRSLGIAVNDVSGDILPATVIIKKLANELNNLDSATRKSVLIKIGGGFQIDKLAAVLNDLADANGTFERSLNASQNAGSQAFAKLDQLSKTTDAAFQRLKTSGMEFASTIGSIAISDDLRNLFEKGASFLEGATDKISGGETIGSNLGKAIVKGIGGIISGPGFLLAIGLGGKLLFGLVDFLNKSLQSQLGLNSKKKEQESLERAIFTALTSNAQVQQNILNLEGNKVKQAEYLLSIYSEQANFLQKMSAISKEIAPTLYSGGIRTSGEGVKKVSGAASGYMPIADAVQNERKMAPAGAKIKIDNNFPLGGGKSGTMVYNDRETLIPNFAGTGGTAIIPNYVPKNAAKGYVPNFADVTQIQKPSLALNAEEFGVAGLTIGGQQSIKKVRSKMLSDQYLSTFSEDPQLQSIFQKYGKIELDSVNVGNVYRRENENLDTVKANEKQIKEFFIQRANDAISPQISTFIKSELDLLKVKPTAAMGLALKNSEKFKFIDQTVAGHFFEMMVKAANMGFADQSWGNFTGASEAKSFDIYGLKSNLAKQYGLPEKDWPYVEVKSSTKELSIGLVDKFKEEIKRKGPLRDNFVSKYGGAKSSASGYIPNFAIQGLASYPEVMAGRVFEALLRNDDYIDLTENEVAPDIKKGKYKISEAKLSLDAAIKDNNFGPGKAKGNIVTVPQDANKDLEKKLKITKNSTINYSNIPRARLFEIARKILKANLRKNNIDYKHIPLIKAAKGYIPNFAKIQSLSGPFSRWNTNYAGMSEEDVKSSFAGQKGTDFSGTTAGEHNPFIGKYDLLENNLIASILGNNTFFSPNQEDRRSLENFANVLSAQGRSKDVGFMGFTQAVTKDDEVISGLISGNFKNIKYEKLKDIFPRLWRAKGVGNVWDEVKKEMLERKGFNYLRRSSLKEPTKILRDAAIQAVTKYNNVSGFNIDLTGSADKQLLDRKISKDVSYLTPFTGSGISDFKNLGVEKAKRKASLDEERKLQKIEEYKKSGILYRDFKNKEVELRKLGRWGNYDSQRKVIYLLNAASGYIPNFAQGPLMDAIQREKLESGLPLSAISVVKDNKLIGSQNPAGLGVINKRDEPNGRIPNFAANTPTDPAIIAAFEDAIKSLIKNTGDLDKAIEQTAKNGENFGFTIENLNKGINLALENKNPAQALTENSAESDKKQKQKQEIESSKELSEQKKKEIKSVQESTFSILKWQAMLSFTQGALSAFGPAAEKAGQAINDFGSAIYTLKESSDLVSNLAFKGKASFKETDAGIAFKKAKDAAGGNIKGVIGGTAAALATEGGVAALAGATLGPVLIAATAGALAIKGLDSAIEALNGSSQKTAAALEMVEQAQAKYQISLTESQKRTIENSVSNLGKGTSIGGAYNRYFGGLFSISMSDAEKNLIKAGGSTGLQTEGNKSIASLIGSSYLPQIEMKMKEEQFKSNKAIGINTKFEDIKLNPDSVQNALNQKQADILRQATEKTIREQVTVAQKELQLFRQENLAEIRKQQKEEDKTGKTGDTLAKFKELTKKNIEAVFNGGRSVTDPTLLFKNLTDMIQSDSKIAKETAASDKTFRESFLFSTELLKKQLESYQQIEKINSSRMTSEEAILSIRKELLSTSETEKQNIEFKLQSLQEEKNYRSEIKDATLSAAREQVSTFISNRGNQVTEEQATNIKNIFYENLKNAGQDTEKIKDSFNDFVISLETAGFKNEAFVENLKVQGEILQQNLNTIKAQSDARKFQNAIEAQNKSILEQQNYQYSIQKEFLQGKINAAQKELDIRRELRDIENKKKDISFERSMVREPDRIVSQQKQFYDAQRNYENSLFEIQQKNASSFLQSKNNTMAFLEKRGIKDIGKYEEVANAKSNEDLLKIAKSALETEAKGFDDRVTNAGNNFYKVVSDAADKVSVSLGGKSNEEILRNRITDLNAPIPVTQNNIQNDLNKLKEERALLLDKPDLDPTDDYYVKLNKKINQLTEAFDKAAEAKKKFDIEKVSDESIKNIAGILPGQTNEKQALQNAEDQKRLDIYKAQLEQYKQNTFGGGMLQSADQMREEIDTFGNKLGKEIPMNFRDSMVQAMKDISSGTKSVKDGLLSAAAAFLQKINDALMTNMANKIVQPITNMFGNIGAPAFASGGLISGGSGTKDDVPSMLMGGEFVINKKAVQAYGKDFFNKLNSGQLKKFASGGFVPTKELNVTDYARNPQKYSPYGQSRSGKYSFDEQGNLIGDLSYTGKEENKEYALKKAQTDFYAKNAQTRTGEGFLIPGQEGSGAIIGQRNLLAFATQEVTTPKYDRLSSSSNSASIDLMGGSTNLSLYALRNQDDLRNKEFADAKSKAFELYLGGIDSNKQKAYIAEQERKAEEERKKAEAEQRKNMWKSIGLQFAIGVGMNFLGSYLGNAFNSGQQSALNSQMKQINSSEFLPSNPDIQGATMGYDQFGKAYSTTNTATIANTKLGGWDSIKAGFGGIGNKLNPFSESIGNANNTVMYNNQPYSWSNRGYEPMNASKINWSNIQYSQNINGLVPFTTSKYQMPPSKIQKKASGGYISGNGMGDNVPTMLNGGEFVISKQAAEKTGYGNLQKINSGNSKNSDMEDLISRLEKKLEDLITKVSGIGSISINVTTSGGSNSSMSSQESSTGQDSQKQKELARTIKDTVLSVLRDEKRIGGLLR